MIIILILVIGGYIWYFVKQDKFCPTIGVYPVPDCESYNKLNSCE